MKSKIFWTVFLVFTLSLYAQQGTPVPIYVSKLPNINDYDIFANSGWDGNWYVGYNVCWIKRLPPVPRGNYARAQIGAKLGRAKTRSVAGKPPWEKEPIQGDIYIAISSTPAWKSDQRYYLISTEDIPLEGDLENTLEGTGESRWFWREVPLSQVNFDGENYLALWSPTQYFVARDSAPILCGGWGVKGSETDTWLNDEIQGSPPIDPSKSLKTSISPVFEPAVVLKLIHENTEQNIEVEIVDIKENKKTAYSKVVIAAVYGSQIDRAWLEISEKERDWKKASKYVYHPPYMFTLNPASLPEGKIYVRTACEDVWLNRGYSTPVEMHVQFKIQPQE